MKENKKCGPTITLIRLWLLKLSVFLTLPSPQKAKQLVELLINVCTAKELIIGANNGLKGPPAANSTHLIVTTYNKMAAEGPLPGSTCPEGIP